MAQITNLRTHRKQVARADKRRAGDANAAKHGRRKGDFARDVAEAAKAQAHLDAHKRDIPE